MYQSNFNLFVHIILLFRIYKVSCIALLFYLPVYILSLLLLVTYFCTVCIVGDLSFDVFYSIGIFSFSQQEILKKYKSYYFVAFECGPLTQICKSLQFYSFCLAGLMTCIPIMKSNVLCLFIFPPCTGVGKSCLLLQFTDKRFQPVHDLTIGKIIIV